MTPTVVYRTMGERGSNKTRANNGTETTFLDGRCGPLLRGTGHADAEINPHTDSNPGFGRVCPSLTGI